MSGRIQLEDQIAMGIVIALALAIVALACVKACSDVREPAPRELRGGR